MCLCPDGVPAEPIHITGGYVHRQLGAIRERRTDSLLARVRLSEYHAYTSDNAGKNFLCSPSREHQELHSLLNNISKLINFQAFSLKDSHYFFEKTNNDIKLFSFNIIYIEV